MSGPTIDQKVNVSDSGSGKEDNLYENTQDVEDSSAGEILEDTARVVDHKAERALCRKFDYRLLPVLALMCKKPSPEFQRCEINHL
jgi:hypothetical protein